MSNTDVIEEAERIARESSVTKPKLYSHKEDISRLISLFEDLSENQLRTVLRALEIRIGREPALHLIRLYYMYQKDTRPKIYFTTIIRPTGIKIMGNKTVNANVSNARIIPLPSKIFGSRLVFSNQAIAVVSSLSLTTLVSLFALFYGLLTMNWLAIWGGSCLLALIIYEIIRISKKE